LLVIVAVLVSAVELTTVARICRVCGVVVVTVPTSHKPEVLSYVPWLGMAETKVRPDGNRSVTCTLVAGSGPLSVRVTVKVVVSATLGFALLTVLARVRSAFCGVSVTLALLSLDAGFPWSL